MGGSIMLNEFANIIGEDFSIMRLLFLARKVKVMLLCPVNDRRHRDFLSVFAPELVTDIAVIIGSDRHISILDEALLYA